MTKDEAQHLIDAIHKLVEQPPRYNLEEVTRDVNAKRKGNGKPLDTATAPSTNSIGEPTQVFQDADLEKMYQAFKGRLIDECRVDTVLLQLLTNRPELEVLVEPRVLRLDTSSLKGRVAQLLADGWLDEKRATSAVRYELARTGPDPGGGGRLSETLSDLRNEGFLVQAGNGQWQRAPGVKIGKQQIST